MTNRGLITAATVLATVFAALVGSKPVGASHSIASFFTPEKAAYCKFHVPLEYIVTSRTLLECWTPNDGFTVWMTPTGAAKKAYEEENKWRFARSIRRLTFSRTGGDQKRGCLWTTLETPTPSSGKEQEVHAGRCTTAARAALQA